jgi:predicted DNA-binding transcriptional regulator YafY
MELQGRPKDYAPAAHLLRVLRLLEAEPGHTLLINELADRLGVHRRTIIRYVDALTSVDDGAGRPVVERLRDRDGAWVRLTSPPVSVAANLYQYAAMVLASRVLGPGLSLLGDSADAMVERLAVSLGGLGVSELAERVKQSVHYVPFGPKEYDSQEAVVDAVLRATLRRQRLEVRYRSAGSKDARTRRLDPHTLVLYRDGLYLYARESEAPEKGLRLYALDRIVSAKQEADPFDVAPGYDPGGEFRDRFGLWSGNGTPTEVVLRIDRVVADVVLERSWPGLERIEEHDKYTDVTLCVEVTPEFTTWIVGFGDTIEVLSPPVLREDVGARFSRAAERHRRTALPDF